MLWKAVAADDEHCVRLNPTEMSATGTQPLDQYCSVAFDIIGPDPFKPHEIHIPVPEVRVKFVHELEVSGQLCPVRGDDVVGELSVHV